MSCMTILSSVLANHQFLSDNTLTRLSAMVIADGIFYLPQEFVRVRMG